MDRRPLGTPRPGQRPPALASRSAGTVRGLRHRSALHRHPPPQPHRRRQRSPGRPLAEVVLVRAPSGHAYGRASYELNLGCNYDCEHCYLGLKRFEGLSWPHRDRLLQMLADAGVLWLQLTGGEPLIDKLFTNVYQRAFKLGMMLSISSNGSRLAQPDILELLTRYRPYRLTISVYGAT